MAERDYYHLDESGRNNDGFENEQGWWCCVVHGGDNVDWNHVVSATNIAVYPLQGMLSPLSYDEKNKTKHLHPDGNSLFQDNTDMNHHQYESSLSE